MKPNPATLDLTSLRLLLTVVEEGNLGRAAERANIAPSAVSRRISNLEARLGVALLHRHDRGVEPTPAALMIIDRVRGVLDLLDQIVDELDDVRSGARGLIRVHAHTTAVAGLLPTRIAAFLRDHPNIEVTIEESSSGEIIDAVRHGVADLGLISGTVDPGELTLIPWLRDELVAVMPKGHPLGAADSLMLDNLLKYPFIAMHHESALVAIYRSHARANGTPFTARAHVKSFEVAANMVASGLGVAILPKEIISAFAGDLGIEYRPLRDTWAQRSLAVCVRDPSRSSGATRALISFLTNGKN